MRDLAARLRRIVREERAAEPRPAAPPARDLTYVPDETAATAPSAAAEAAAHLGGVVRRAGASACVVVDRTWALHDWHGRWPVARAVPDPGAPIALLDPRLPDGSAWARRVVFFDIETTGLSGGAGTLAFLVGCGWFEGDAFRIRQWLLTGPAGEPAMLDGLADVVREASLLVTFNGRTFDVPLMETRWAFHRRTAPTDDVPHFDMLPPARRLWGGREEAADRSCSLLALERVVLGFHRHGDVPGFEIPVRYFHFLRTGEARAVDDVLEHNRHDLLSLAVLTAHALWLAREGPDACRTEAEQAALGRLYERAGDASRARAAYERASASLVPGVRRRALARLATILGRAGEHHEAAGAWREILAAAPGAGSRRFDAIERRAAEALAIHHEHRAGDLASAKAYAETLRDGAAVNQAGIAHRLARLDRKIRRSGSLLGS